MTKEEAIKELSYIADEMPSMECADWKDAISTAIKALEREPRWIPVTERLPEEGTFVLASYNSDEGVDVIMTYYNKYGFTRGLMTAWMPLPEPYKGEQEDDKA